MQIFANRNEIVEETQSVFWHEYDESIDDDVCLAK